MYTGIVKGQGVVKRLVEAPGLNTLYIELPAGSEAGLEIGASVAVDGVCLTVTTISKNIVSFDVMQETLNRTTLGSLKVNSLVNIERSAKQGQEIGGHLISGHVDCMAKIERILEPENNKVITFKVPETWMRYIFDKGFIALNGTSLTITNANRATCTFDVWFIPETLKVTTFGIKQVGEFINLEVERHTQVIVDTVRDFLAEHLETTLQFRSISV